MIKRNEKGQFITNDKKIITKRLTKKQYCIVLIDNLKMNGTFSFNNRNISMLNGGITRIQYTPKTIGESGFDLDELSWYDHEKPFNSFSFGQNWQDQSEIFYSESELLEYLLTQHLSDLKEGSFH